MKIKEFSSSQGNIINVKLLKILLILWFILLIFFCNLIFPYADSFYYWTWSQKLQLSYLDGPPLIAYVLKLSTLLFGNGIFAINIVGLLSASLSALFIFKTSKLLNYSKEVSYLSTVLFVTYPFLTTKIIYIRVTYDCLESLFFITSTYYALKYLKDNRNINLIYLGISFGLLLLSKYSGVILLLAYFIFFIVNKRRRVIFKNKYLYLSMVTALIIFSPVIYWNYQNEWVSFKYQLNGHSWDNMGKSYMNGFKGLFVFFGGLLSALNILIVLFGYFLYKCKSEFKKEHNQLFITVISMFLLFWLYKSIHFHYAVNYTLPILSFIIMLITNGLYEQGVRKLFPILIFLFMIISIVIILDHSRLDINSKNGKKDDCLRYQQYIVSGVIKAPLSFLWPNNCGLNK